MMKDKAKWVASALAAVAVLSAASMLITRYSGSSGTIAQVYKNGTLVYSVDLGAITEGETFTIGDEETGWNTVTVEPGRIRVSQASCHNQNCVDCGWSSGGDRPIVCLPNKLVIKISADTREDGVDAISG